MEKKETILLDARLISVIDNNAFDAELPNGHRITAFIGRDDIGGKLPQVGAQVTVEMSPYDMSKGRLVLDQEQNNESTSFS
ncbi:MAG: translation initiation factor IF-1 [Pontiellaceae bacterium]|nr:translation initiation factor IF-1 [Pontiellaceae bacterium]MBN2784759.1 translation initiation factor IF-1 [Pontiellaceae bacterium]